MFSESKNHIIVFTVCVVIGIIFLCSLVITLGYLYQRKQLHNLTKIEEMIANHKVNLMQVEVQSQHDTFAKISGEISRTVGKKLKYVESKLLSSIPLVNEENIKTARNAILALTDAVEELRDTSRSMSSEIIKHYGLKKGIEIELDQLKKYKVFSTAFQVHGEQIYLKPYDELLIFRIIQEGIKNSVKHSHGDIIEVSLHYNSERIVINVKDNGIGYPKNVAAEVGKGLHDIKQRLKLLKGTSEFLNTHGALLAISIPITEDNILLETDRKSDPPTLSLVSVTVS